MRVKALLFLCFAVLVGCNGGGDGDGDSITNKTFSMPTEKSSTDFFENNNINLDITYHNLSTGEQVLSGSGEVWGKEYSEQIDGVERTVNEFLMDIVINGNSQTDYEKTYIIIDGASWYKYDYETKAVKEERLYSSPQVVSGNLDSLPATAVVGDFGDLPDYQIIDNSYSSDDVKRTENSWKLIAKGENAGVVVMTSNYNRYDEKIQYSEEIYIINEFGEILNSEMTLLDYRENLKMIMTIVL